MISLVAKRTAPCREVDLILRQYLRYGRAQAGDEFRVIDAPVGVDIDGGRLSVIRDEGLAHVGIAENSRAHGG